MKMKQIEFMNMSTHNGCSPATFLIEIESRNTQANFEQNMVVMASDDPWPHSPSLRLGLPAPQPSRRQHAQSLLGPSFHDPETHHVLESHPEHFSNNLTSTHRYSTLYSITVVIQVHCLNSRYSQTLEIDLNFQDKTRDWEFLLKNSDQGREIIQLLQTITVSNVPLPLHES